MEALVTIIKNSIAGTFHPIWYAEKHMPGPDITSFVRYKSKGHHTLGFASFDEAMTSANSLANMVSEQGYKPRIELEILFEWDGKDIPADVQIRERKNEEHNL